MSADNNNGNSTPPPADDDESSNIVVDSDAYQTPAQRSMREILDADKEDESLQKYKAALLGAADSDAVVVDSNDSRRVLVGIFSFAGSAKIENKNAHTGSNA